MVVIDIAVFSLVNYESNRSHSLRCIFSLVIYERNHTCRW